MSLQVLKLFDYLFMIILSQYALASNRCFSSHSIQT